MGDKRFPWKSNFLKVPPQVRADLDKIDGDLIAVAAVKSVRVADVQAGQPRRRASQDRWASGVGIVIFWPALFFLMRGDKADELARMKVEYDALVSAGRSRGREATREAAAAPAA